MCCHFPLCSWTFRGRQRKPSQTSWRERSTSLPRTSTTPKRIDGTQGENIDPCIVPSAFCPYTKQSSGALFGFCQVVLFFVLWNPDTFLPVRKLVPAYRYTNTESAVLYVCLRYHPSLCLWNCFLQWEVPCPGLVWPNPVEGQQYQAAQIPESHGAAN